MCLPILIQGCGPDAMQFAASQHRLEQVCRRPWPLPPCRRQHGIGAQSHKEDYGALRFLHLLEPALSRSSNSPRTWPRDSVAPMSRETIFLSLPLRHVAANDALARPSTIAVLADAGCRSAPDVLVCGATAPESRGDLLIAPMTGSSLPCSPSGSGPAILFERLKVRLRDFGEVTR